ncbi:hypothetical protein Zmor_022009 [Zophobas morio]|uniref:Uncharacterized protein n=1 Tax=Zophobas morio TaxID=2755281 RepID=A0AA38I7L6_9CUCU|nr:hypothetical protein Zmor_022009 [Zophobas morio]
MERPLLVMVFVGLCCAEVTALEIKIPQVPSISTIVNRITNTTFGIVRGGINAVSRTVDRIIDTFGRVEDRLRHLLEEFRKLILRGIPELSIPILDPLHIEKIEFDVVHDAAGLKGNVQDVTVRHISKFVIDDEKFKDLGGLRYKLDLNLTFPRLTIDGFYKLNGLVGDSIPIFGEGEFWLNLIDFKLAISTVIQFDHLKLKLTSLFINIKLRKLENHFDNFMHDEEIGELFNKAISKMAPEAIDLLWPDIKKPIEEQVKNYVNSVFDNATISSLARRLFNVK